MLNVSERLMGTRLNPSEEYRTWVFSDPHFGHEASVAIFGRPFRNRHHGDGYLLEQWTHGRTGPRHGGLSGRRHHGPPDGRPDRPPPAQTGRQDPRSREPRQGAHPPPPAGVRRGGGVRPPAGRARPALHPRAPRRRPGRLREHPRPHPPEDVGRRAPDQRVRRTDRVPAEPGGRREGTGPAPESRGPLGGSATTDLFIAWTGWIWTPSASTFLGNVWIGSHPGHLVGSSIRPPEYISIHNEAALRSGRQVEHVAPPGGTSRGLEHAGVRRVQRIPASWHAGVSTRRQRATSPTSSEWTRVQ